MGWSAGARDLSCRATTSAAKTLNALRTRCAPRRSGVSTRPAPTDLAQPSMDAA